MKAVFLQRAGKNGIEAGDERSESERGTDQTAGASTCAACAQTGASGAGTDLASPELLNERNEA